MKLIKKFSHRNLDGMLRLMLLLCENKIQKNVFQNLFPIN